MGRSKPLVKHAGESFLAHAIRLLWARCEVVIVVLGKRGAQVRRGCEEEFARLAEGGALRADLKAIQRQRRDVRKLEVHFVENRAYRRGMYTSARLGLATALGERPDAVLLTPVDHPVVKPATVDALASAMLEALDAYAPRRARKRPAAPGLAYAIVPRYRGRRGHPVALSAALAQAVTRDLAAESLADAIRRHARLVGYLDVTDRGVVTNINTPGRRAAR
jgi:CTP:molybdopterin cytidylyltransferase MocA